MVELVGGRSAINGATPSNFKTTDRIFSERNGGKGLKNVSEENLEALHKKVE